MLTDSEIRQMLPQLRAALPPMARTRQSWEAEWDRIIERFGADKAEMEADYRARVAREERNRPKREAAAAAAEAAYRRRAAELGAGPRARPSLVLASAGHPERLVIW